MTMRVDIEKKLFLLRFLVHPHLEHNIKFLLHKSPIMCILFEYFRILHMMMEHNLELGKLYPSTRISITRVVIEIRLKMWNLIILVHFNIISQQWSLLK